VGIIGEARQVWRGLVYGSEPKAPERVLKARTTTGPPVPLSRSFPWLTPPTPNTTDYLQAYGQSSTLFASVFRIASAVAGVRWRLYREVAKGRQEIERHPLLDLLSYVNEFMTGQELYFTSQQWLDIVGEAFWSLGLNAVGRPVEIWPIPPDRMKIKEDPERFISSYVYEFGAVRREFSTKEIIHFKFPNPYNLYRGLGSIQATAVDVFTDIYAGIFQRNLFFNSAEPGAILNYESDIEDKDLEQLQAEYDRKFRGIHNAHRTLITAGRGEAKFTRTTLTNRELDFTKSRKALRDNILLGTGMPMAAMGIAENVNRANAESGEYVFARWTLVPRLELLKSKLNEQLVPFFGDDLELDYDDPVPKDKEFQLKRATDGVKAGILTVNEGRQIMGFDPSPRGDVFILPMSVLPTSAKGQGQTGAPVPSVGPLAKTLTFTEDEKELKWHRWVRAADAEEGEWRKELRRFFDEQEEQVIASLAGIAPGMIPEEDDKELADLMTTLLAKSFIRARDEALTGHKQFENLPPGAREWLLARALKNAKDINETTRRLIAQELAEGWAEGEGTSELTGRVRGIFRDCKDWRAERIARTETIAAAAEGSLLGYEASEVVKKTEFYAALDERTCEECMARHTHTYPLSEASGIIPVHPNCRCVWIPLVE